MKFNLEEILKNTLTEKQMNSADKTHAGSIDENINGVYLDEERLVFVHEEVFELPLQAGKCQLATLEISEVILDWALTNREAIERYVFLDTETTGLSSGAGTWIFLTGLGFFSGNSFIIKQYFMIDPAGEDIYMEKLAEELDRFKVIVSFNGKSYDVNLLKNRFIMNGINPSILKLPNIDLLFLSRRLWRDLLVNCKLQTLEADVLGICREHEEDIESSDIPQKYFDYIADGNTYYIEKIFNHNLQDILSMPVLLNEISQRIDGISNNEKDFREKGRAGLYIEQKKWEKAKECLLAGLAGRESLYCKLNLANIYKRRKEYDLAIDIWQSENDPNCYEELAKYYEHTCRDYSKALDYTLKGIDLIHEMPNVSGRQIADWYKRRGRLERKLRVDEEA